MTESGFAHPTPEIPFFEGKPVETTKLKLTSLAGMDIDNATLRIDDLIHVKVVARVSQVHHDVAPKGHMERIHTAKVLSVEIVPWNEDDPEDTGVFRG